MFQNTLTDSICINSFLNLREKKTKKTWSHEVCRRPRKISLSGEQKAKIIANEKKKYRSVKENKGKFLILSFRKRWSEFKVWNRIWNQVIGVYSDFSSKLLMIFTFCQPALWQRGVSLFSYMLWQHHRECYSIWSARHIIDSYFSYICGQNF